MLSSLFFTKSGKANPLLASLGGARCACLASALFLIGFGRPGRRNCQSCGRCSNCSTPTSTAPDPLPARLGCSSRNRRSYQDNQPRQDDIRAKLPTKHTTIEDFQIQHKRPLDPQSTEETDQVNSSRQHEQLQPDTIHPCVIQTYHEQLSTRSAAANAEFQTPFANLEEHKLPRSNSPISQLKGVEAAYTSCRTTYTIWGVRFSSWWR